MNRSLTLKVNEIFGPTLQGEGPFIGTSCIFLRLAICNLACIWCDTPYAWDWRRADFRQEIHRMKLLEVIEQIQGKANGIKHLVISGGEPLLQQKNLNPLLGYFLGRDWKIEVETAGTIVPTLLWPAHFNVSPKLANSGNSKEKRYNPEALEDFAPLPTTIFKFVVQRRTLQRDLEEIEEIVSTHRITREKIYLMPEGIDKLSILGSMEEIAKEALQRGWNMTTRLHVLAWGNKRGK